MLNEIGYVIRRLRMQKGIGLNEFASILGVSAGYLSNLETGKTETIQLSLLERLQNELNLFPNEGLTETEIDGEFEYRVNRTNQLLLQLHVKNKKQAEYLLSNMEHGLELFEEEK